MTDDVREPATDPFPDGYWEPQSLVARLLRRPRVHACRSHLPYAADLPEGAVHQCPMCGVWNRRYNVYDFYWNPRSFGWEHLPTGHPDIPTPEPEPEPERPTVAIVLVATCVTVVVTAAGRVLRAATTRRSTHA